MGSEVHRWTLLLNETVTERFAPVTIPNTMDEEYRSRSATCIRESILIHQPVKVPPFRIPPIQS
jgi:hypothetical protein